MATLQLIYLHQCLWLPSEESEHKRQRNVSAALGARSSKRMKGIQMCLVLTSILWCSCLALYVSRLKCQRMNKNVSFLLCCTLSLGCSVVGSTLASKHSFTQSCIYPQWEHHFLGFFTSTTLQNLEKATTKIRQFFLELWLKNSHLQVPLFLATYASAHKKEEKKIRLMKIAELTLRENLTQFQRPWLSTTYQWR